MFFKKFLLFIVLDFLELSLWVLTLPPFHLLYEGGPIDAQNGIYFICLLLFYIAVPVSMIALIFFLYTNIKEFRVVMVSLILNIHVFIIIFKFFADTI